ncbi:hypothetical protein KIW84_051241 [Lathyrus oleraceus]|uniref:Uncharacterized protein n=1 Tax=Pisum sativum TaxID=3888 RepID=A0A9D4WJQ5_PEA|nr:hypothetical protein KIW84_051241 [Pisum sativum]
MLGNIGYSGSFLSIVVAIAVFGIRHDCFLFHSNNSRVEYNNSGQHGRAEERNHEKAKEVEEFFDSHPMPAIVRTLKQSLERVNINANWVQSVKKEKGLGDVIKELAYRKY